VEDDPESFSFWKIKHGIRWTGMPSWKWTLANEQIWSLALFLKHMDKLHPRWGLCPAHPVAVTIGF